MQPNLPQKVQVEYENHASQISHKINVSLVASLYSFFVLKILTVVKRNHGERSWTRQDAFVGKKVNDLSARCLRLGFSIDFDLELTRSTQLQTFSRTVAPLQSTCSVTVTSSTTLTNAQQLLAKSSEPFHP
jgi:hypothetical protein